MQYFGKNPIKLQENLLKRKVKNTFVNKIGLDSSLITIFFLTASYRQIASYRVQSNRKG